MKVLWAPEAEQDRAGVWSYLSADNPQHATARMDELFSIAVSSLAERPNPGHSGKISGTRELIPYESYRLVYEVENETVWMLALLLHRQISGVSSGYARPIK
uniref:Addiction module toxin, RelE/StbE n=1 Tax=mine drainage metagenome TaxID=410659 RepID=E6QRG3_9ZZZZ